MDSRGSQINIKKVFNGFLGPGKTTGKQDFYAPYTPSTGVQYYLTPLQKN